MIAAREGIEPSLELTLPLEKRHTHPIVLRAKFYGSPNGIRIRDSPVKGERLYRLTMGPFVSGGP